jgi:diguanylate cyclase (GGDEF)-like protein/PAS domain S-box-containing protein
MNFIKTITVAQILIGAAIMLSSIAISLKIRKDVSENLRIKWVLILSLMVFFFFGYILSVIILILGISFPLEIVTGTVFLGGAFFVYAIMNLTQVTLQDINKKDQDVKIYAEGLAKRTLELENEITERRNAEEALKKSEEQYRSLVESTEDSIYLLDRNYRYIFMNKKHITRMGFSGNEYLCHAYSEFHSSDETKWLIEKANNVFNTGESVRHEHKSSRDGRYFLLTLSPIKNSDGTVEAVTVISKDITDYKTMEEKLHTLSLTDQLTGVYNRRGLLTLVDQLFKLSKRQKQGIFLLYADIDNLKEINDTFGHKEGDTVLVETANIFKKIYRESDIIARIGGDEFVVIPVGTAGDNIEIIISRLQKSLEIYNSGKNRGYKLSLSTGIVFYDPEHPCSINELLVQADKLMYEQKMHKKTH